MYFICWRDYDGSRIEEFKTKVKAEERVVKLLADDIGDYGFCIDAIIQGKKVEYEAVSVVEVIKLNC